MNGALVEFSRRLNDALHKFEICRRNENDRSVPSSNFPEQTRPPPEK